MKQPKKMSNGIVWFLMIVFGFLFAACSSREHMETEYGNRSEEFWKRQKVYADVQEETPKGLDSEEAALVQASYRKDMGGGVQPQKDSRVILLEDK